MDQLAINGSSVVFPAFPAGPSIRDLTGVAALATVALPSNESASDIIDLIGVPLGAVTVIIGQTPQAPMIVGTDPKSPLFGGSPIVLSWIKVLRNNTAVPITISGPPTVPLSPTVVLAGGLSQILYSPDGNSVFAAGPAV